VERALLVETHNRIFGIPSNSVVKSYTLSEGYARNLALQDSITLKGKRVPLVKLSELFKLGEAGARVPRGIVLAGEGNQIVAIVVDRVLRNKNVFIQASEQGRTESRYISALSRLENGKMVYILNTDRLKPRSQA
jgi:chemotaxis protein histidine kinase CheA